MKGREGGSPREFTQAEKEEQEIAEACNRLIRNSIICWNYLYLARPIEKADDEEAREGLRRTVAAHSPMSWAHVNMLGEYDFSDEKLKDSMESSPETIRLNCTCLRGKPKRRKARHINSVP